jgi:transcriptional regulator with XRE-family HTH domain
MRSAVGGEEVRKALGQNIKKFRNGREWSQADLAEKAGLSITFLSAIERGTKWPYPDTLYNLAVALEVGVYELFKPVKTDEKADAVPQSDAITKEISRFYKDVAAALNKSVTRAMNQSMENVYKRHLARFSAHKR